MFIHEKTQIIRNLDFDNLYGIIRKIYFECKNRGSIDRSSHSCFSDIVLCYG